MKTSIAIVIAFALTVCASTSIDNSKAIKKYRSEYTKLVVKWEKSNDSANRLALKQQMDDLKAKNLHLFTR